MTHPIYTPEEAQSRETFLALMWSFSYPGVQHALPEGDPFAAIAAALLDIETTHFTPDPALAHTLTATGSRASAPESASYHFYPLLNDAALDGIARASVGTMLYPDSAATLIIAAPHTGGAPLTLIGAGIETANTITPAVPPALWTLRARAARFPMGWDVLLIDGSRVIGIPRSTQIEG